MEKKIGAMGLEFKHPALYFRCLDSRIEGLRCRVGVQGGVGLSNLRGFSLMAWSQRSMSSY